MARVALNGVRKSYGTVEVIHGVDVEIHDGEFIVIVGPSGCGKSTLLRMVAGLEEVTGGRISIGDRSVENLEPKDRDVAMVFQNYALYPHMSVYDNMAYGLKMRGFNRTEIAERVKRAAEVLAITTYLDRKPRNLSGGQRQRVAMGRAIVRNPSVFLFDEPLSNLDAKLRIQMRLEIKTLQQSLRTTSIYVTHDQVEAMTLADRLIVMNEGVVEQIGPPMKLYEDPESTFVAGFIGAPSMNFLEAVVREDRESVEVPRKTGAPVQIPVKAAQDRMPGPVLLGIRPEHLIMSSEGEVGTIPLEIYAAEPLGADTILYGRLFSEGGIVAARVSGHVQNVVGARHWFKAHRDDYFLFEPATGKRVRTAS